MQQFVGSLVAALGALAALGLGAGAALAQPPICGDLFEQCQIADDVYAWNADEFEEFFPLDEKTCSQMAQGVFAQCERAVKDDTKCWIGQFNAIPKNMKAPCNHPQAPTNTCYAQAKYDAKNAVRDAETTGAFEISCCEDAAGDFFDLCVGED